MKDAFALSATSEATGFPKENLIDWNPDTYWKPTAVGTVSFKIDLTSAKLISGWAVWLHNAHVNVNPGPGIAEIKVYYSSDDSTYTLWDTKTVDNESGQPILFGNFGLSVQSKRYWKFEVLAPDLVLEVSTPFLYAFYGIAQGNQAPQSDQQGYLTRKTESASGRVYVQRIRTRKREYLSRQYLFVGSTDWESLNLVLAFKNCRGDWRPLIIVEDGDLTTAKLVRFASSQIQRQEIAYRVYSVGVVFVTETYIELGDVI